MTNRFSLDGKIALVTGASRGLGRAIAKGYAEAGADTVLVARDKEALENVSRDISSTGRRSWVFPFDLSRVEEIDGLFHKILRATQRVGILANVAGAIHRQAALEFPLARWEEILEINLTAPFVLSQCFARECVASNRPGKIINIASLASERTRESIPAYNASKGGIKQLTMALAVEWASCKINVNGIGPGYFHTELTEPLVKDREFNQWVLDSTPMKRWGQPGDLVGAAIFLASGASDFITGQILYVDGGWLANL